MEMSDELRQSPDFAQGRAEAEVEIAAGRLGHRAFGKLVTWSEKIAEVLQDRYQIAFQIVGGCTTRSSVKARAVGYNERMNEEIAVRFGSDVVAAIRRELTFRKHTERDAPKN